jgi:hypothetical protein
MYLSIPSFPQSRRCAVIQQVNCTLASENHTSRPQRVLCGCGVHNPAERRRDEHRQSYACRFCLCPRRVGFASVISPCKRPAIPLSDCAQISWVLARSPTMLSEEIKPSHCPYKSEFPARVYLQPTERKVLSCSTARKSGVHTQRSHDMENSVSYQPIHQFIALPQPTRICQLYTLLPPAQRQAPLPSAVEKW